MGTEKLASGRSTDLEIAKGAGLLGFAIRHLFPLSVFPFCVEQRTQQLKAAWLSAAVSSSGGSLESCPPKQSQDFVHCTGIKPSTSAGTSWGHSFAFCRDSKPGSALPSGVGVQGKLFQGRRLHSLPSRIRPPCSFNPLHNISLILLPAT